MKPTKGLTIFPKTVMASKEFVHLHLHTQFSLLDGAIKIKELPEYAQQLGYQAVAITDHGNLFGSYKFYTTLKGAGLKPIIGMEAYITKGSLKTKIGKGSEDNYTDNQNHHIVLIAKNDVGLKNLMKLSSIGFLEGFHYKPRIDLEVLNQHREGLICLTACLKGLPTYYAARGQEQEAERWLLKLLDIFGKEDLYVEIQHHWHLEEQDTANRILIKLARKHGLKLVATADVHYLRPEDKTAHMILTALQMKKTYQELLQSPIGQKLRSMELHFASPEEMWRRFENKFEGWEEALLNTLEVAEKVADKLEYFENKEYKMPVYEVPEGESLETYFRKLAIEGLKKRIKERGVAKDEKVYWERLEYEMDVISKMGFPGYFLIVQDFINWAKSQGIPVGPGRGCVLPDTNVMLGSGELKPIEKVEVGDFVLSHRGAVLPVLNKFVYDVEETLVKIEAGNEELTLTHDHKVLALKTEKCKVKSVKDTVCKPTCGRYCKEKPYKEYKLTWLPAEELKKGDFLVFPRQPSANKEIIFDLLEFVEKSPALRWNEKFIYYQRGTNKLQTTKVPRFIKFDHKLAKILGYFLSDGYTKVNQEGGVVGFGFHIEEEEYAQEILSLFEEVFKVKGKIYKAKNRKALTVEFKTKIVAQFLRKLCGSRAANKKIPLQIVLNGKDEYVKTLIAYLFRGDGYAGKGSKTLSIKYSTVSKTLAYQLRLLLARFGFWASITVRKRKNKNWNPEYSVKLSGAQLLKWNETFEGFPIKIPQQRFFRNDSFFVDEKFIYVKVRKVEKVPYKGKVYDITVPIDHSYTTSAVAIHNSAGGSLVAYALGITDIDPIKHDLLFERFLNPDRVSMPDIDVDFSKDRREEVIEYVRQKYGRDNVSQIITYNVLKSKSVIRDVCRALGVPLDKADKLAKLIPQGDTQGSQLSLEEMTDWTLQELKAKYGERPDIEDAVLKFRKMINEDPTLQEVVEIGKKLDGLTRHTGFHAAGVVIAPQPLKELVPLYARKEKDKETKKEKFTVATQYDMGVLEEIGLLKMDFLGLKTLTELDRMKKMVKQLYGKDIDFAKLDYEDPKVYELLKSGRTTGVFQLESRGMQNLLKKLKPDRFDDIIAVLALYRPGPLKSGLVESFVRRKHGKEPITYDFPELEPILKETYGLCLTGDTEITLADGRTLTLEEIVKNNLVGLEVLSLDEETYKLKPSKVTRVFDNGIKEVYEIVLTNGLRIKATSDHKFLTPDGWKELKDLKPKEDLLAVPKKIPTAGKQFNIHKLLVLAYLLADGYISGKSGVAFVNKDPILLNSFKSNTLKGFTNVKFLEYVRTRDVTNIFVVSNVRTRYKSNPLLNWLEELGLRHRKSAEKFIPEFVFDLKPSLISKFLAAYWDCDGYTGKDTAHVKTISSKLAIGIQKLLAKLGIESAIYETIQEGKNVYQVNILNLTKFKKEIVPYMVSNKSTRNIPNREPSLVYSRKKILAKSLAHIKSENLSKRKFSDLTGVSRSAFFRNKSPLIPLKVVKKINNLLKDKELEKHINGEINFIPIKEITYKGKERVYDLEVEETHNFIGNGIVCHNCIYQEQIMKMSQVLAGFTPGEADTLRKGIGKKRCLTASTLVLLEDGSTVELLKLIENIEFQREGKVRCRFCNSDKTYKNGDRGSKKSFYCLNCRKTFTVEILDKPLKVLALNENLKFEPSKIIEVHRNGEDTVYRLKLRYSGTVEATDKHLFLTPEGWKPLKLLKKGEKIATPLTFSVKSSGGLTQKEAKLLGYLLGDGNLKDVVFYNSDEEILKDYMSLVKTLFPESEFKIYNNSNSGKVIYIHERNRKSSIRSIKKFLRSLGFKTQKAGDKFVPERIMTSEIATVSAFLGSLWSTDGSIVIAKNYEYTELLTKSKTLALQVLLLLRRLGITAILKKKIVNYKGERRTYYRVEVRGKENLERFIETVGVHIVGKKQDKLNSLKRRLKDKTQNYKKETIPSYFCSKLFEVEEAKGLKKSELAREVGEEGGINLNLNVSPERFRKYALLVKEKELLKLCDAQIFWDTVEDIEFVGVKQTYDLTIENSNFVANACIVHNSDIIAKMKTKFIEGAVARGKDRKKIEELWNSIEKFASYSFNKSHSTAYAYLSFQTAFFKTYYPGVFFAVKLSTEENQNKFISLIKDAKLFGFELLPPDINKSDIHFTIEEKDGKQYIRYGLAKIKGVGEEAAKAIQEAKRKYGKFKSLADFIKKVDTRKVNKKVIEALIAAGAFDFTGESREELLRKVESQDKLSLAVGQNTLFAPKRKKKKIQNVEEFLEILKKERQLLGFYISGHPLDKYQYILEKIPYRIEDLHEEDISDIKLAGVVVDFKEKRTRSGKYMAVFNLIDKTGLVECVIFPETYEEYKTKLGEDQIVIIEGYVSVDPETENKKVIVKRVFKPEEFQQEVSVKIVLKEKEINDKNIQKLKKLFSQMADPKNGAPTKIVLRMDNGEIYEILLSPDYWILPNANNLNTLSQILPKRIILE